MLIWWHGTGDGGMMCATKDWKAVPEARGSARGWRITLRRPLQGSSCDMSRHHACNICSRPSIFTWRARTDPILGMVAKICNSGGLKREQGHCLVKEATVVCVQRVAQSPRSQSAILPSARVCCLVEPVNSLITWYLCVVFYQQCFVELVNDIALCWVELVNQKRIGSIWGKHIWAWKG